MANIPNDDAIFFNEISQYPLLSAEEEIELSKKIKNGDKEALHKMVTSNLRLVAKVAKNYVGLGLPFMDLVQEGAIGLQSAAERYEWEKGYRFSTYATWWIREQINKAILTSGKSVRIPSNVAQKLSQFNKIYKEFVAQNHREPTAQEITQMSDLDPTRLLNAVSAQQGAISLDYQQDSDDEVPLSSVLTDTSVDTPEDYHFKTERRETILEILDTLNPREKDILIKRFGLDDGVQKSLEQVGSLVGLTRERVRQIELNALNKLRNPIRARVLAEYK
jgi:RNA polymerase primary sigma factor